jgi:RNA polymerase sigma-70 factor (ECF subfamily)
LLSRARAGHEDALDELFARCIPALTRWARGRLPAYARDLADTQDLVQDTVLKTLNRLDTFDAKTPGALQAYLRQAVSNRIRDEIRRIVRHPPAVELTVDKAASIPSPLEEAIGSQEVERYEAALARLRSGDRELIIARIELQQSFEEVAAATGRNSANAARVAFSRALNRLVEAMDDV